MYRITGLSGWLKNSFIDFPGCASVILFFGGCNLRCPYCHNPSIVKGLTNIEDNSDEIWNFLEKRKTLIEGVVLSGGEPTLQPNIAEIANKIKAIGYKTKLDTNGLRPDIIKNINPDYLAVDIKTLPNEYAKLLRYGSDDPKPLLNETISIVKNMKDSAEIRITVAPGIVTLEKAKEISNLISGVNKVFLQRFNKTEKILNPEFFVNKKDINDPEIMYIKNIMEEKVANCIIR